MLNEEMEHGTRNKALSHATSILLISLIAATILIAVFCPPALVGLALATGMPAFLIGTGAAIVACDVIGGPLAQSGWLAGLLAPLAPILLPFAVFTRSSRLQSEQDQLKTKLSTKITEIKLEQDWQALPGIFEQLQQDLREQAERYNESLKALSQETEQQARESLTTQLELNQQAQKDVADVLEFLKQPDDLQS